jgi:hypothetical protein
MAAAAAAALSRRLQWAAASEAVEPGGGVRAMRRPPQVLLLHQRLLKEHPSYDLYLWLDGDAAFINHNIDIRLLPEMFPGGRRRQLEGW